MRCRVLGILVVCGLWSCGGAVPKDEAERAAPTVAGEPTKLADAKAATPGEAPRPVEPAPAEPAPLAEPTAPAEPATPVDVPAIKSLPPTERTPPTPHPEPLIASVEDAVTFPDGVVMRVAAQEGTDQSLVWAQAITSPGSAVVLRKTSGAVDAIAATFDGTTLWVAWRSHLGEGKKSISAVAGFDRELRLTAAPRILRTFDDDGDPAEETLQIVSRPGIGAGATVAAMVGKAPCRGMFPEHGPTSCSRVELVVLDAHGATVRSDFRLLDGGQGGLVDLVDVGQGVVSSFYEWHGGALIDVAFVPYAVGEPVRTLGECGHPPVDLAWFDGALLTVCPDPEGDPSCSGRAGSRCGMLRRVSLENEPVAPDSGAEVRFHGWKRGCKDGQAILRLSWVKDRRQAAIAPGHLDVPAGDLPYLSRAKVRAGAPCKGPVLE